MYCPTCQAELWSDRKVCPYCDSALINSHYPEQAAASMSDLSRRQKIVLTSAGAYALVVFVLILLAFDFDGRIQPVWTLAVIGATLPWSLISILFVWALIHGAGLDVFAVVSLAFGALNGCLIGLLISSSTGRPSSKSELQSSELNAMRRAAELADQPERAQPN